LARVTATPDAVNGLKLPSHLRYLSVHSIGYTLYGRCDRPTLGEENCHALASSLRGLRISEVCHYQNSPPVPHLSALENLTYLGIEITAGIENSFLDALDSMPALRVLEILEPTLHTIEQFPRHCSPHLEHLTIRIDHSIFCLDLRALTSLATHLKELRSLVLIYANADGEWSWLETVIGSGRLEYLCLHGIDPAPFDLVRESIRACKVCPFHLSMLRL